MKNTCLEKCSTSLTTTERHVKIAVSSPLTPVRMAVTKKTSDNAGQDVEEREAFYAVGGNVSLCTIKTTVQVPQKTINKTTVQSSYTTPAYKVWTTLSQHSTQTSAYPCLVLHSVLTIANKKNQLKCPSTSEWIGKHGVHEHNGILSVMKKNKVMTLAAGWMELEIIILSKVSKVHKDKYRMLSFMCRL